MLYILAIAFLIELAGGLTVWWEVRGAQSRWRERFRPKVVTGTVNAHLPPLSADLSGTYTPPTESSVQEEIQRLDSDIVTLEARVKAAEDRLPQVAQAAAVDVEQRLVPQIQDILRYLSRQEARPWWFPWWLGPGLVIAGILIGSTANLYGAWDTERISTSTSSTTTTAGTPAPSIRALAQAWSPVDRIRLATTPWSV